MYAIFERDQINASKGRAREGNNASVPAFVEAVSLIRESDKNGEFQRQLTRTYVYTQARTLPIEVYPNRLNSDKQKTKQSSLVLSTNAYCAVP